MANKFKKGDLLRCLKPGLSRSYTEGRLYFCHGVDKDGDPIVTKDNGNTYGEGESWFELAKRAPLTKSQRRIAAKEAEPARLKEAAAKRAKDAAERKAKAERAKVPAGLSAAGKRVVAMLSDPKYGEAFGCQAHAALALACAITGDKTEAMQKAIAK